MSLICCFSGKKRAGKNTCANYVAAKYLEFTKQISAFSITSKGLLTCKMKLNGCSEWQTIEEGDFNNFDFTGIKFYSFADPLKLFCMDVFGLTHKQCYGTDEDKNSVTKLRWSDMPNVERYALDPNREFMTARQLLQYFGTNIIREMFNNAWVNATISKITRDAPKLAIIVDARFPNEINGTIEVGGRVIRLLRDICEKDNHPSETALDDFPLGDYSYVIDNRKLNIATQLVALNPIVENLFAEMKEA